MLQRSGHAIDGDVAAAGKAADIEANISVQASIGAGIDRQIAEISPAVSKATEGQPCKDEERRFASATSAAITATSAWIGR